MVYSCGFQLPVAKTTKGNKFQVSGFACREANVIVAVSSSHNNSTRNRNMNGNASYNSGGGPLIHVGQDNQKSGHFLTQWQKRSKVFTKIFHRFAEGGNGNRLSAVLSMPADPERWCV